MATVTVQARGVDDFIDLYNNFWGLTLPARVTARLAQAGYNVTATRSLESFGINLLGDAVPYLLELTIDTGRAPADKSSVRQAVIDAIVQSVGTGPEAVALTSFGDATLAAPAPGLLDQVGDVASSVVTGVNLLTWAVAIGAIALVYVLVSDPGRGSKIIRSVRW